VKKKSPCRCEATRAEKKRRRPHPLAGGERDAIVIFEGKLTASPLWGGKDVVVPPNVYVGEKKERCLLYLSSAEKKKRPSWSSPQKGKERKRGRNLARVARACWEKSGLDGPEKTRNGDFDPKGKRERKGCICGKPSITFHYKKKSTPIK